MIRFGKSIGFYPLAAKDAGLLSLIPWIDSKERAKILSPASSGIGTAFPPDLKEYLHINKGKVPFLLPGRRILHGDRTARQAAYFKVTAKYVEYRPYVS
jgi:hypothetical protein